MRRGEIWWADLPAPVGRRPVVLLSRNAAYRVRELVTVAPVTTRVRGIASEVTVGTDEGLPKPGAANLDSITTIPKRSLTRRIAALPPHKIGEVERALHFSLGLRCGVHRSTSLN
jgi:mRNA interferase MazF